MEKNQIKINRISGVSAGSGLALYYFLNIKDKEMNNLFLKLSQHFRKNIIYYILKILKKIIYSKFDKMIIWI